MSDGDQLTDLGRIDLTIHTHKNVAQSGVLTINYDESDRQGVGGEGTEERVQQRESVTSTEAEYGNWRSPITSKMAVEEENTVVEPPHLDPITGYVFWCEELDGRGVVFHYDPENGEVVRWTPYNYDVRTRVHEYGGGSFTVHNNSLFFSNGLDGAIYRQEGPQGTPTRLTNTKNRRYADGTYNEKLNTLFYVVEDHGEGKGDGKNGVVMVDASTGREKVLISHADFFASPRVSQDGKKLVWVQWNLPNMPWDENRMFVAQVTNGELAIIKFFQHGSMMMPSFDQNDELFYVHDSTGWWNLYRVTRRGFENNLTPETQEVGWPVWRLGRKAYDINPRLGAREAVVICGHDLTVVDLASLNRRVIKTGYNTYSLGVAYSLTGQKVYVVAGDGVRSSRLVEVEMATGLTREVRGDQPPTPPVDMAYLSPPTLIQFPTTQADFAYGYLYMPKNPDFHAPTGSKPPLVVRVHGGPTAAAQSVLNLRYQFLTSRGFAILDVDYRGSSGYGKLYRNKLNEMWGVYDVEDVLAGASHLVEQRLVDKEKLGIEGRSVAAYTALSALTIPGSIFTAGASYWGVSDPEMLATMNTSKLKRHYLEALIGNLDRHKDRYVTRSPLRNHQRLHVPVIFFHGSEDKVVPSDQAKGLYDLLKSKGLPTAFMLFPGEGHGLISCENEAKALEAEFFFFTQVFNITAADAISDVKISNLELWRNERMNGKWRKIEERTTSIGE
ncbi:hypothetical protein Pmani_018940 [Petrolisthes manimaculis]|uniref:Peptidase S9 prolyl oligopeptidase catalytic domain-containing protein n=1 Tax=Petrolisthes manimaculis TaxID=1843537 RepID=A0AAE1PJZ4_9EUCA|nr:hypothetical protein Pmani_018940 [Petrolisthes manimaculis]